MSLLSSGKDWGREKYWRSCGGFNLTPGWLGMLKVECHAFFSVLMSWSKVLVSLGILSVLYAQHLGMVIITMLLCIVLVLQPAEVGRLQDPLQSTSDNQSWCLKEWLRMVDTSCLHCWPSCSFCESHRWCLSSQGFHRLRRTKFAFFLSTWRCPRCSACQWPPFLANYLQLPHPKSLSQHSNIQKSSCDFVIVPVHAIGRALLPLNAWSGLEVETENVLN